MNSSEKIKKAVAGYFNDPKGTSTLMGTTMSGTGETVTAAAATSMEQLKQRLEEGIKATKDLEKLSKQIEITITPEGLRIELLEDKNGTFYELGSARLSGSGQELLALLGGELKTLPNALLIEGHTDATPYSSDATYTNWELSADRANSARRLLQQDGVRADQVTQVRGYADQLLRVKTNAFDPSNRRISILVKNDAAGKPPILKTRVTAGTSQPKGDSTAQTKPADAHANTAVAEGGKAQPAAPPSTSNAAAKPGLLARIRRMLPGAQK
jgi:chemotaxis protein MotB